MGTRAQLGYLIAALVLTCSSGGLCLGAAIANMGSADHFANERACYSQSQLLRESAQEILVTVQNTIQYGDPLDFDKAKSLAAQANDEECVKP